MSSTRGTLPTPAWISREISELHTSPEVALAYLAVTNHTKTQESLHAAALAHFAMDAVQVTRTPHHLRALPIRPHPLISAAAPPSVLSLPASAQRRSQTVLQQARIFCISSLPLPPFKHQRSVAVLS